MEVHQNHIGILKHAKLGLAEDILMQNLRIAGLVGSVISPQEFVFGSHSAFPNLLIARCELSSLSEPILAAYLAYFHECEARGIPIINPREFLLRGQNKYLTHLAVGHYLAQHGLADTLNPETYLTHSKKRVLEVALRLIAEQGSVVLKNPDSGRGEGIYHVTDEAALLSALEHFPEGAGIMVQATIEKEKNGQGGYRDIRIYSCREPTTGKPRAVSAFYRNAPPGQFLTNTCQGGIVSPLDKMDDRLIDACETVMEATKGDVAGLDFARDPEGNYKFFEVNVAFETSPAAMQLVGTGIWEATTNLAISRLALANQL